MKATRRQQRNDTQKNHEQNTASVQAFLHGRYHKVVRLLDFMTARANNELGPKRVERIVETCEAFASQSQRQWLKVAGEAKAQARHSQRCRKSETFSVCFSESKPKILTSSRQKSEECFSLENQDRGGAGAPHPSPFPL